MAAHPGTAAQAAAFAAEADRNGVMLQAFHWDTPSDGPGGVGGLWRQLVGAAGGLAAAGFTSLWLPPAVKGFTGARDVGYGVGAAGTGAACGGGCRAWEPGCWSVGKSARPSATQWAGRAPTVHC